ncbi:MAG: imidazolonepropionase [Phycisphaerae bacterium]|nr:imidazolonepropionase [Phycisphaerae bacterium]
MNTLRITNARILTMEAPWPLGRIIPSGEVVIEGGIIRRISESPPQRANQAENIPTLDARGRVLMPAFIDAHTHALWAGDRLDEWDMKRRGVSYLEILHAGGGIMSTVRAVRAASDHDLAANLRHRLHSMLAEGTTTIEVKSGYGLSTLHELRMLRAIRDASTDFPGTLVPTALIAHAIDPDVPAERFIRTTIEETLPAVHDEFPGITIDAYCEQGAWPLEACIRLFERARSLGHPFRVHTDQFNSMGMTEWAMSHGALSLDHLEASSAETLRAIASTSSYAVLLPCTGFNTDGRYVNARTIIDAAGAERLVIATNLNPGSAPCASMPMAIALAVRMNHLTPQEAIAACTRNPAALLGLHDRGVIATGKRADLVLLRNTDERLLAYEFGGNPVDLTIVNGFPHESRP